MIEICITRKDEKTAMAILKAIDLIDKGEELQPAVMCKDCKLMYKRKSCARGCDDILMCEAFDAPIGKDFYCAYGERREG